MDLPFLLTVHDDLRYLLRDAPLGDLVLGRLATAWREADERFVITRALGDEYCDRYGPAGFQVVTDGVTENDFMENRMPTSGALKVYFAGLFHRGYRPNLRGLLAALDLVSASPSGLKTSLLCRCGSLPEMPPTQTSTTVVPFGTQDEVRTEIADSDLLYLPLMLEPGYADMIAFSLSTKLVTYLAAGAPILYHGPDRGAAYELLAAHDAAILATSNDPAEIAETILEGLSRAGELVQNARELALRDFMLSHQRERFWGRVPDSPALVC
jgi:glycosyltransferase involved in cell wall biosynthesis